MSAHTLDELHSVLEHAANQADIMVAEVRQLQDVNADMLAALRKIASYYANGAVRLNSDVDVPEIVDAAIAKAEGKS